MKFLHEEFQSFQEIIIKKGLNVKDFTHVKKRGHLYVHQNNRTDTFCFLRKKETKLNEQLQFEDNFTYYLDPQNKIAVDTWEHVLIEFEKWLEKAL